MRSMYILPQVKDGWIMAWSRTAAALHQKESGEAVQASDYDTPW